MLLARVAGALKAPLTAMASVLAALPRGMAISLGALAESKPAAPTAPTPAAAAAGEITDTSEAAAAPPPADEAASTQADQAEEE